MLIDTRGVASDCGHSVIAPRIPSAGSGRQGVTSALRYASAGHRVVRLARARTRTARTAEMRAQMK